MDYEALRRYLNENDPYSKYSHVQVVKLEPGKSEVKMEIGPENQNFMGFCTAARFIRWRMWQAAERCFPTTAGA